MARPKKVDDILNGIEAEEPMGIEAEMANIMKPPVEPEPSFVPIYAIKGLDKDECKLLVESRMKAILDKSSIPHTCALLNYSIGTNVPRRRAVLDLDHRYVKEAWEFYTMNVENPSSAEFIELVRKVSKVPERVLTKVVEINLN